MAGDKTAVELAMQGRGNALPEDAEQIDFIAEMGLERSDKVIALEQRTPKIGRPEGSRNRRTVEMANYLLNRYTSPLEVLAQIATMPLAQMAAALGCTLHEAMQERRLAAIALAPYTHQKMPVAVDFTNKREIHLTIVEGLPPPPADDKDAPGVVDLVAREISKDEEAK